MYLEINKLPKHIPERMLEAAIAYAYTELEIPADVVCELSFIGPKHPYAASCFCEDDVADIYIWRKLDITKAISALFHELVHVKQFVDGRLKLYDAREGMHCVWNGIDHIYEVTPTAEEYDALPWEADANEKGVELFKGFMRKWLLKS